MALTLMGKREILKTSIYTNNMDFMWDIKYGNNVMFLN